MLLRVVHIIEWIAFYFYRRVLFSSAFKTWQRQQRTFSCAETLNEMDDEHPFPPVTQKLIQWSSACGRWHFPSMSHGEKNSAVSISMTFPHVWLSPLTRRSICVRPFEQWDIFWTKCLDTRKVWTLIHPVLVSDDKALMKRVTGCGWWVLYTGPYGDY